MLRARPSLASCPAKAEAVIYDLKNRNLVQNLKGTPISDKRKSRKKGTGGEMSGLVQQQIAEEKAEREAQLQRERDAHDQAVREQQVGF